MRTFKDTRGKSWYDIIPDMNGQLDVTINYPGTIRAFHWHAEKIEWMFVASGEVKFVLTDPHEEIFASQGDMVKIEPGRWHGYQALGEKEAIVIEVADKKHDLVAPDDERKPYNEFNTWEKEKK